MSAAGPERKRRGPTTARVAAAAVLIVASTTVGFVVGGGTGAVPAASPTGSPRPSVGASAAPTGTPEPVAPSVPVPTSCTAAYPEELVERQGSGYLFADSTSRVAEEMVDADVAGVFEAHGGIRCAWSDVQAGPISVASGIAEVPSEELAVIGAQLRASGAECVFLRGGLLCRTGEPDGPDDTTFVGEVHMLRDGLWTVHVGHWGVSEFAAAMNDALFGPVEVDVPVD